MDSLDSRFGQPDDWGLSPQRHGEIANELGDHLDCLQQDEGRDAADKTARKLAEPRVRRQLSSAQLVDQVVATLNRLPNRQERHELLWLLIWFALLLLFTLLSGKLNTAAFNTIGSTLHSEWPPDFTGLDTAQTFLMWLFGAICRAGFLSLLIVSMVRAWRIGPGVFIARLLQYKLIHTVLVLGGTLAVSGIDFYRVNAIWLAGLPGWINHLSIGAAFLLAGLILAWQRPLQRLSIACFSVLIVLFLIPAGPTLQYMELSSRPIGVREVNEDGIRVFVPDDSPAAINERLEQSPRLERNADFFDLAANRYAFWVQSDQTFGPRWSNWKYMEHYRPPLDSSSAIVRHEGWETLDRSAKLYTPFTHPGSGLAWLAVPLPLMGVIGFVGMVLVMGRRNPISILLYSIICVVAVVTTILPFAYAQQEGQVLVHGAEALVHTPLPGFESLMLGYNLQEDWMLIFGLLFSAGIPWLLTGLFLRSDVNAAQAVDDRPDMEAT